MLRAQNLHIDERFHLRLIAECSARANKAGPIVLSPSASNQRMSLMEYGSAICSSRNTDSHLLNTQLSVQQAVRSSLSENSIVTGDLYGPSSTSTFDYIARSSIPCPNIPDAASNPNLAVPLYHDHSSDALSSGPAHETQQAINPTQSFINSQATHTWQHNAMQHAPPHNHILMAANIQSCQLRDRPASPPNMPLLNSELQLAAYFESPGLISKPTQYVYGNGHCRSGGQFQPQLHGLQTLQRSYTTPDFCPIPNNFVPPTAVDSNTARTENGNGITMLYDDPDADPNDSSHSSAGMETPSFRHTWAAWGFELEDFVNSDDSNAFHY